MPATKWFCTWAIALELLNGCGLFDFPEPQPRETVRRCDPADTDACGPGRKCYDGARLGGKGFCTESCNRGETTDASHTCQEDGVLLSVCHPTEGSDDRSDCPLGLNCYRTSLTSPLGVCLDMPLCRSDDDCRSSEHRTCAASLLRERMGILADLPPFSDSLNHLNCIKTACLAGSSLCPPSETCLANEYAPSLADICVPGCGEGSPCPPNYSCTSATSGAGRHAVCVPGVPGVRCEEQHCLLGTCEDSGAGFNICTSSCPETDCSFFNSDEDKFQCVDWGGGKHCITPRPFHGANCYEQTDCDMSRGEICSWYTETGLQVKTKESHGECRVPCKADGTCEPRGGVPHTCFPGEKGGCFPGEMGMVCTQSSECFAGLTCEDVSAEPSLDLPAKRICTAPCESDGDCDSNSLKTACYCSDGLCRYKRDYGAKCDRDTQCLSKACESGRCAVPVGAP